MVLPGPPVTMVVFSIIVAAITCLDVCDSVCCVAKKCVRAQPGYNTPETMNGNRRLLIPILFMALALLIAAACSAPPPSSTLEPTVEPTVRPTPTSLPIPTATPIPTVTPEPETGPRLGIKHTPNPANLPLGVDIGYLAPDFRLETEHGEVIVLSDFRGKPVFMNFFAVWCGPCRFEMPEIESVYNSLGDELVVLTVDVRESVERVKGYKELLGLTMPTVMDTRREVANSYQVPGLPWTFILDEQGVIRHIKFGAFLSREEIIAALGSVGITEESG